MFVVACVLLGVLGDITGAGLPGNAFVLSFDDGPNNVTTPELLATLKKHNVLAFFNFVGVNVDNPALMKQVVADGHIVGSHTWGHAHLRGLTAGRVERELDKTEAAFMRTLGDRPWFFRAPYGEWGAAARDAIRRRHYIPLGWDIDTVDWTLHNPDQFVRSLDNVAHGHGMILAHEYTWTTHAMDVALKHLEENGHRIVHPLDVLSPVQLEGLQHRTCSGGPTHLRPWCTQFHPHTGL